MHPLESAAFARRTPIGDIRCPELVPIKRALKPVQSQPKEVPRRWAHSVQQSERLHRSTRLEAVRGHHLGAMRASRRPAAPAGARWCPGPLRAPPPRADHAAPPGAAARGQLHRAHRNQHGYRLIKDEFDAFLECGILAHGFLKMRCNEWRPRQAAGFQLQTARTDRAGFRDTPPATGGRDPFQPRSWSSAARRDGATRSPSR